MAKVLIILAVVTTLSSLILTMPVLPESMRDKPADEQVAAIPTDILIQALQEQHPEIHLEGEGQSRGNIQNLLNLTAALQGAPNSTASFTFIPLITLIFG